MEKKFKNLLEKMKIILTRGDGETNIMVIYANNDNNSKTGNYAERRKKFIVIKGCSITKVYQNYENREKI